MLRPGREEGSRGICPAVRVSAAPGRSDRGDWWLPARTHLQTQFKEQLQQVLTLHPPSRNKIKKINYVILLNNNNSDAD